MTAVIFGFFGLARFHVLKQLNVDALTLVDRGEREYKISNFSPKNRKRIIFSEKIIGYFFDINDKFHAIDTYRSFRTRFQSGGKFDR